MITNETVRRVTQVFTLGAKKYGDRNWEKGMDHSRLFSAAIRHLEAYWMGEDVDEEWGKHHLAHAGCCVLMLLASATRKIGKDDRPLQQMAEPRYDEAVRGSVEPSKRAWITAEDVESVVKIVEAAISADSRQ
jgi:hypothetical protein